MAEVTKRGPGRPRKQQSAVAGVSRSVDTGFFNKLQQYDRSVFKKEDKKNILLAKTISNYTIEQLELLLADPVRNRTQLIEVNNYFWNISGFFRTLITHYTDMILYRYHYKTVAKNQAFLKVNKNQFQKNFISYGARIEELNLGQELQTILIKMALEDACFAWWAEETAGEPCVYYLPSNWCSIRAEVNGVWVFDIDTRVVSQADINKLPRMLQKLLSKHKGKTGDEAFAPVSPSEGFVFKWNNHFQYIFPPFTALLINILRIAQMKDLEQAKAELDAWSLVHLEIPIDPKGSDRANPLLLSDDVISQYVLGIQDILPPNVGILPSPFIAKGIEMNKNMQKDRNLVKDAVGQYAAEAGVPANIILGEATSASEAAQSLKNDESTMWPILRQISDYVNLKMRMDGWDYPQYSFVFELLNISVYNQQEFISRERENAAIAGINKFEFYAAQGYSPTQVIGQAFVEGELFGDMLNNLTALGSAYNGGGNLGGDGAGRPKKPDSEIGDSGEQTRENPDSNNPANRKVD